LIRATIFTAALLLCAFPAQASSDAYERASEAYADELSAMYNRGEISWEEVERRANNFDAKWAADERHRQQQRQQNAVNMLLVSQALNGVVQQQAQQNSHPAQIVDLRPETYDIYTPSGKNVGTMRKRGTQVIQGN
jgi:Zn-dependent protease with chaperone function